MRFTYRCTDTGLKNNRILQSTQSTFVRSPGGSNKTHKFGNVIPAQVTNQQCHVYINSGNTVHAAMNVFVDLSFELGRLSIFSS